MSPNATTENSVYRQLQFSHTSTNSPRSRFPLPFDRCSPFRWTSEESPFAGLLVNGRIVGDAPLTLAVYTLLANWRKASSALLNWGIPETDGRCCYLLGYQDFLVCSSAKLTWELGWGVDPWRFRDKGGGVSRTLLNILQRIPGEHKVDVNPGKLDLDFNLGVTAWRVRLFDSRWVCYDDQHRVLNEAKADCNLIAQKVSTHDSTRLSFVIVLQFSLIHQCTHRTHQHPVRHPFSQRPQTWCWHCWHLGRFVSWI